MKETELKKLLEGKDLTKAEDFTAVLTGINNDANSTISKRDETIEVLKKENDTLKTNAKSFETTKKELEYKVSEANKTTDLLNKKNYIYQNINHKLNDEDLSDLLTMTNSRMAQNKDAKFEDVVNEVAEKRMFKAGQAGSLIIPPAPKANAVNGNTDIPADNKISKSEALSWLNIKTHK